MTTYNGTKFLEEQLDSLRLQTLAPHEVLIFDDCSSDGTPAIVSGYIQKHNLGWTLHINEKNLGWKKNYMYNIPKAKGDVIFLCDQDDIWLENKCEIMMETLEERPDCNVLLSNYFPYVVEGGAPVSRRSRFHSDNRKVRRVLPSRKNLQSTLRPGCTYCFKKSFFEQVSSYWDEKMSHDAFLSYMGLLKNSLYLINYRSIKFRRHETNNSPLVAPSAEGIMKNVSEILLLMEFEKSFIEKHPTPNQKQILENIYKIILGSKKRYAFFLEPSLRNYVDLVFLHHGIYLSAKSIVRDFQLARSGRV
ncbi:MAG: glycosyltransferase [Sphaerochaeta sp.]|nr:glycosyltransferase [Sphaerochaeta sp.]